MIIFILYILVAPTESRHGCCYTRRWSLRVESFRVSKYRTLKTGYTFVILSPELWRISLTSLTHIHRRREDRLTDALTNTIDFFVTDDDDTYDDAIIFHCAFRLVISARELSVRKNTRKFTETHVKEIRKKIIFVFFFLVLRRRFGYAYLCASTATYL